MQSGTIAPPVGAGAPLGAQVGALRDGPRLPYLPGVDGLRAVAVGSVLLYHAEFSWMAGGYLGVEVFFVISGYLITSLLLAEKTRTDRVSLGNFYLRRARRLLPALFVTLIGVLVLAQLFARDQVASLRGDVVSGFAYVTNWYFIVAEKSYFESGAPSMVKHLWSLAIEEQFYLVWPLLFSALLALFGRRRVLVIIVVMAAASASWMAYLAAGIDLADPNALNRLYMATDTRAAGLLIGAALSVLWSPWRLKKAVGKWAPLAFDAAGVAALALLGWALYGLKDSAPELYQFGFAKVSFLTAVVIAVVAHPAAHLGKVVGCAPMVWIGLRSYGIYLYHFPIFLLIKPDPVNDPTPNLYSYFIVRLALTLVAAELSFRFVEMPVRRGAIGRLINDYRFSAGARRQQLKQRWVTVATVAGVSLAVLAVSVVAAKPVEGVDYVALGTGGAMEETDVPPLIGPDGVPVVEGDQASAETTIEGLPPGVVPFPELSTTVPVSPTDPSLPLDPAGAPASLPAPPATVDAPPTTAPHGSVRAIGDSVMLGAKPVLLRALGANATVDAAVSRQVSYAVQTLQKWDQLGQNPDILIIHLGTNGTFNEQQFESLMQSARNIRKVLVVTNKVPRRWQDSNNTVIGDGARRHPNAVLVDWYSYSIERPEYFAPDGYHLKYEGALAYAHLIVSKMS